MKLSELLTGVRFSAINVSLDTEVSALTMSSESVEKGCGFFAVRGLKNDGNNYVGDVLAKGASVIFTEVPQRSGVPYVLLNDARESMGIIAGNFYKNTERNLKIIAVVGTNGKTTTCRIISHILKVAGKKVATIGTLGAEIDGNTYDTGMTTPDPLELHKLLSLASEKGAEYAVMEVTAHAIYFKKLAGVVADVAVFTNLSRDHLDFFKTMENYAKVKESYFTPENVRFACYNVDDVLGKKLASNPLPFSSTYGLFNPADTFAMDITYKDGKTECLINAMDVIFDVRTSLVGDFNVYNLLGATSVAVLLGIPVDVIHDALCSMKPVEGRFDVIDRKKKVVIDFAHTPDGLKNLLITARKSTEGKVILVFGCGGNRDSGKRAVMGEIAGEFADFVILTEDNSRDERTSDILYAIEEGLRKKTGNYVKIEERKSAITYGILIAGEKDLVVIAGKGGENYIERQGEKIPYSDKQTVEEVFGRYEL